MSARLPYLPGLLAEGAPVFWGELRAVLVRFSEDAGIAAIAWEDGGISLAQDDVPLIQLELNLETRIGRALAAWWVQRNIQRVPTDEEQATLIFAQGGYLLDSPGLTTRLHALVLVVAGRESS